MSNRHKADEKVQVTVRCRPMNQSERQRRIKKVVDCSSKSKEVTVATSVSSLGLTSSHQTKSYSFDKVFGTNATQIEVYKSLVESQLQDVLAGYNCTVLAYGQTGTGKTYTMEGERSMDDDYSWDTDPRAGIIPRTLSQLFDCLEKSGCEFSVRVSLLEIYNEDIYDLLSPSTAMPKMKIYEDNCKKGSVVVSGLTEVHVRHKSDVYQILQQGAVKRRTTATNLNEFSSRSHSVFSVTVHTKDITHSNMEEEELVKIGKLNLVDLAGSENIGRSGAVDKHAREAGSINQSLLTLGRCITALVDRTPHIPYRESKLTRLLQDSLGGATKTSIIATISPGSDNFDETLSTLEYAARAKNIHNKPRVNQKLTKRALIKEYDDEIERLRRDVVALREKNGVYVDPQKYDEMVNQIEALTAAVKHREEEVDELKELFTSASSELDERTVQLRVLHDDLFAVRKELAEQYRLKEAHAEHGQEVTKYASEILETTGAVTTDIAKVHDKVDRVKRVHENNLNTFYSFSNGMKTDIDQLCQETFSVIDESKTNVEESLENLASYKENSNVAMKKLSEHVKQMRQVTSDCHKDNTEVLTMWNTQADENFNRHNNLVAAQNAVVYEHCKQSNAKLEQLDQLAHCLLNVVDKLKAFTDIQCQQMETHARLTSEHTSSVRAQLADINTVLKQKKDKERRDKIALEEILANATERLGQMHECAVQSTDACLQKSAAITDAASLYEDDVIQRKENHVSQSEERRAELLNALDDCGKMTIDYKSKQKQQLDETQLAVESKNEAIVDVVRCMKEQGESVVKNCEKLFETSIESADRIVNEYHVTADATQRHTEAHVDAVTESTTALGEDIDAVRSLLEESGRKAAEVVESFASEQVEKVVPTGQTPARKSYEYSRKIPQPPIEEEVLLNFNEKLAAAESEEEEEEDVLNEQIDEESMSSTGSKAESELSSDLNLNESITIPDVGGMPFFKRTTRAQSKLHPAASKKPNSRIPLKPVNNLNGRGNGM